MSDLPPPEIIIEKSLPFELAENILSRLPVKTLKRFRAVEKSWCRLIDSDEFKKKHLQLSLASNSNRNLISGLHGFHWLSVDSLDNAPQPIKLGFEYDTNDIHAISNSCNGLVVVKRDPEPLILLNPFSREFKVLPVCPIDLQSGTSSYKTTYGFGYDSKNDVYKVVNSVVFENAYDSMFGFFAEWIYSIWWQSAEPTIPSLLGQTVGGKLTVPFFKWELAHPRQRGSAHVRSYEYGVKESWVRLIACHVEKDGFIRPLVYIDGRDKILVNYSCRVLTLVNVRQMSAQHFNMSLPFAPGLCVETLSFRPTRMARLTN